MRSQVNLPILESALRTGQLKRRLLCLKSAEAVLRAIRPKSQRHQHAPNGYYSPAQLGQEWGLSPATVRRLFARESGVLIVRTSTSKYKRAYRSMRIPREVAERVRRLNLVLDKRNA